MKFALNYSGPAANLAREGQIGVDLWKCPDWPDMIATAGAEHPVYVHFELRVGSGKLDMTDWHRVEDLLVQTGTPFVNLHLFPCEADFQAGALDDADVVIEQLLRDVRAAVEHFGPEQVIVENAPHQYPGGVILRPAVDPDVISCLVREIDCGFLLDLSHARITARQLGMNEREYVAQLPVDRLRELHLTGLAYHDGLLIDHMPLTEEDWLAAEWAMARIQAGDWAKPWAVAFEYGGVGPTFEWRSDPAAMAAQVPRLRTLVTGNGRVQ